LRPSELTNVAERLTAYLDPDGQLSDDTDRAARRALNIGRQRADGMSPITGLLDPATRALVDAVFSTLGRPVADGDTPDPRSAAQRNDELVEVHATQRILLEREVLLGAQGWSAMQRARPNAAGGPAVS